MKTFLVAGGDLRQIYCAELLAQSNQFDVYITGFDNIAMPSIVNNFSHGIALYNKRVDFLVLPLPVSSDNVLLNAPFSSKSISADVLPNLINEGGIVFGGKISPEIAKLFHSSQVVDYLSREELNVLNAVPTAEGAVQIAMEELTETIHGLEVLITGYGRISKVLVQILRGMGAKVTVVARKYSDLAWAEITGCKAVQLEELHGCVKDFKLIFNTIPATVFTAELLALMSNACEKGLGNDCDACQEILQNICTSQKTHKMSTDNAPLIIDLASKPGGVDMNAARCLGVKVVWALSLPCDTAIDKHEFSQVLIKNNVYLIAVDFYFLYNTLRYFFLCFCFITFPVVYNFRCRELLCFFCTLQLQS
jgi:dipicolinate synthase subunit A